MKKVFLFDLDSTLLEMNQDFYLKYYFEDIYNIASKNISDPKEFMKYFDMAAYALFSNDGSISNEELFWQVMNQKNDYSKFMDLFDDYYKYDYNKLQFKLVKKTGFAKKIVDYLNSKGYILILATQPVFPKIATINRMKWADLEESDFKYISTYENSHYCKPKWDYYTEILNKLNIKPEECIMIGNDIYDDFHHLPEEIDKYLITDYLINNKNLDITLKSFTLEGFYNYIINNF